MPGFYSPAYPAAYSAAYATGYGGAQAPPSTGLKAWYKADAGITLSGSTVTAWADQSGNSNNLANTGSPTFKAKSINGLPAVTFSGLTDALTQSSSPLPANNARHVITVSKPTTAPGGSQFDWGGYQVSFRASGAFGFLLGDISGTVYCYSDEVADAISVTSPPTIENTAVVCELSTASINGSKPLTFVVNGVTQTSPGVVGVEGSGNNFKVGNGAAGNGCAAADICEVLVYDHVLSAGDLSTVRSYLQGRYGISL